MIEFNYKVETGPDGIRWVSIEPLQNDILKSLEELMKIDTKDMKQEDVHILDMKVLSLRTIYEFLGSLITADNLAKLKTQNDENKKEKLH